jgi:hypothetical protein
LTKQANGGGNIAATNVFVRLKANATVAGSPYSGNVTLTGDAGAATKTIATSSSTVNAKALTITGATASNKTYDGTNSATVTASPTLNGVVGADVVTINAGATGTFAQSNIGTNIVVTSNYSLTGADAGNYTVTQPSLTANITALNLTITGASASNKVYDGTNSATVTASPTLNGVVASDVGNVSINAGATGTFASSNVGTAIVVTSNYSLTGSAIGNYTLSQPSLTADITAISLTITGATASNKTYDATTSATVTASPTLNGVLAGDVANVSIAGGATGTFASANVGTSISVTSNYSLTGSKAGNYTVTQPTLSADITAKNLTITGATASNKVYDGTNAATVTASPTLNGVLAGDVANVSIAAGATGTFASVNVGTAISVTSNYSLTGSKAGNYTVTQPTLTANITVKNLTITGASASNKVYDGTNSATVTASPTLNGVVASDVGNVSINAGATGTFASSNVGTAIVVTSNYSLTGSAIGNYTLSQPSLTADITAISLTITGASANNKTYNGTTAATITASPTLNGVLAGDVANVSIAGGATGTFASANVGTSISVTSNYSLTGSKAGNYTVTQPTLSADITAKSLTITGATASNKTYDGTNAATVTASPTLNGVLAGDVANVSIAAGATGTFASVNVGSIISVTSNYSLTGSKAGNYTVTQPTLTANITKKNLTITGVTANNKVYDGNTTGSLTGTPTLNGIVGADVVTVTGSPTATFASSATNQGQTGISVNVTGYTLGGAQAANYSVSQPTGLTATIYASEPGTQVTNITFSNTTAVSFDISWTNGSGTNRLVLVNETGAVSATPADFTSYTASANWNAKGSQIGTNNYVVYIGNGSTVSLTNLSVNTTYNVQIFEFNGAPGSGLENYNGNTNTNNPNSKKTNNVDTNSTFTAGGSPNATIASTVTTLGGEVGAFTFTATDIGGDFVSTRFTQLVFKQGAGNQVADWTQLIQGAELYDNATFGGTAGSPTYGKHLAAVIGATTITIPGISVLDGADSNHPTDLGTIENGTNRVYTLKIYFKTSLGGTLPSTVDNKHLEFSISGADVTPVPIKSFFAPGSTTSSGGGNDAVTVTATKININQQPSTSAFAGVALSTQPIFEATDANNNRDLDINNALNVGTSNGSTNPASAPTNFASGLADFTASGFKFNGIGTTTMNVSITSPSLTSPNSNSITITSSTNQATSGLTMSASPLIAGTTGSISGGVGTNVVLGFSIQTSGAATTLTDLTFLSSPSVTGLVKNFKLYSNSSDSFTGATQVATSSSLVFSGMSIPVSSAITYFYLVCDVEPYFSTASPAIVFQLPAGNFTVASGGSKTGSGQTSIVYNLLDNTPPTVSTIDISSPTVSWSTVNGTSAATLSWLVTFSEPVTGVDATDFATNRAAGADLAFSAPVVTGSGSSYTVTINSVQLNTLSGIRQLYINVVDDNSIIDVAGNSLGGATVGDGNFNSSVNFPGSSAPGFNDYYTILFRTPVNPPTSFVLSGQTPVSFAIAWNSIAEAVTPAGNTYFFIELKKSSVPTFNTLTSGTYPFDSNLNDDGRAAFIINTGTVRPIDIKTYLGIDLTSGLNYDVRITAASYSGLINAQYQLDYLTGSPLLGTGNTTTAASAALAAVAAASSISSLTTTQPLAHAQATPNFQFSIVDEATDLDNAPTKFSGLVVKQGAGNGVADWTQILAGAELTDGTNVLTASSITPTQIIFTSVASSNSGDLGYIDDATTKTYSLNVWLKSSLGGSLPTTVDNLHLSFSVNNSSFTINNTNQLSSTFLAAQSALSGALANAVDVEATQLDFTTSPNPTQLVLTNVTSTSAAPDLSVVPVVRARDVNGNTDLNYAASISVTGTSMTTTPNVVTMTSGVAAFPTTFQYNDAGDGTLKATTATANAIGGIPTLGTSGAVTVSYSALTTLANVTIGTIPTTNCCPNPYTFKITDDGGPGGDGSPTRISQIKITKKASANPIPDWRDFLGTLNGGALLYDGTSSWTATVRTINQNDIVISNMLSTGTPSDLGYIADGQSKNFTLYIYPAASMGGGLPAIIDHLNFDAEVIPSNITLSPQSSSILSSQANIASGPIDIDVEGVQFKFITNLTSPLLALKDISLQQTVPQLEIVDANGNRDLDLNTSAITLTSAGSILMNPGGANPISISSSSGLIDFPSNFQYQTTGDGTLTIATATTNSLGGSISSITSAPVTVQAGTASTISNGASAPATISSLVNSSGAAVAVFNFNVNDDPSGTVASNDDGLPTLLSKITITANSTNNAISDWSQALGGAILSDGNNANDLVVDFTTTPSAVTANSIAFSSILTGANKLGYVADNGTKNYTLKVWLKSSLGGTLPSTIDGLKFEFQILQSNIVLAANSTGIIGGQSSTSGNNNAVDVQATKISFTTPNAPAIASLNSDFAVAVEARDANNNRDKDFTGKITALSNANNSTMVNGPTLGSTAFVGGVYSFNSNFQFTSGLNNDIVTLTIAADKTGGTTGTTCGGNAICGTSLQITLQQSYESAVVGDPTYTFAPTLDYVNHQETTLTSSSLEIARMLLVDGSRSGFTYGSATLTTNTDSDGNGDGDKDGAGTALNSITIRVTNPSNLRAIALYSGNTLLGVQQNVTNPAGTGSQTFTFTGSPLLAVTDDNLGASSIAPISVRVSFRNTAPEVTDQDPIQISITAATLGTGSGFYPSVTPGTYIAGVNGGLQSPAGKNLVDVIATSIDFTTQPSSYAGVNEPVGPFTSSPLPTTSAGVVTARDKFALVDTNFAPASITLTDANNNTLVQPTGLIFVNGVADLKGMQYPVAVGSNGAVSVITTGPSLNSSVVSSGNSIPCNTVNVLDVTVTMDTNNGVVPGSGSPPQASLKGGLQNQNIFGLKFTANAAAGAEPKLKGFTIGFKSGPNSPTVNDWYEDSNNGVVIFSGFNVYLNGTANNVTSVGGVVSKVSSASNGYYDQIFVDLSATPQSLTSGPLTFYLVVNVDASTNTSTQTLVPYFIDGGYGTLSDKNTLVSNGTATGSFYGNEYSFASTQPPTLKADIKKYPTTKTYPYLGQPNVDPAINKIVLEFDTNVGVLDNLSTNQYTGELWSRFSNTKVADLKLNTVVPVTPYLNPVTPASQATVVSQTIAQVYPKLVFDIVNQSPQPLANNEVYFVKIRQGSYDPVTGVGHGIADYGLNFFGGISDNTTLYFKTSNNSPINLNSATSTFNTTKVGTLTTNFDQLGTAYFLIVKSGDPVPTVNEIQGTASYALNHPTATIAAPTNYGLGTPGTYQITAINSNQTYTFASNFVPATTYDVYIYAKNDAQPTPIYATSIYSFPGLISGITGGQPSKTPNNPSNNLLFTICPDSYVTINDPMIIGEQTSNSFFSAGYVQDFNILLPTGYQFDVTVAPNVQLIGSDFLPSGTPAWSYSYTSYTVLNIRFKNTGSSSTDFITVSGLSITGKSGSPQGAIQWFYGNNVFTPTATPYFTLAQIALRTSSSPDFTNTFWYNNQQVAPFTATNGSANTAFQKTVNAIPDNYSDPSNPGSVRLLPIAPPYSSTNTFATGDYLASFFSGTGVSGDLLTLNAVTVGAAFNISMTHTDLNGCQTIRKQQYVVYDHNSPISKKLGRTINITNPTSPDGTKQDIVNANFPTGAANSIVSPTLGPNELAGYSLLELKADLPPSAFTSSTSVPMSGSAWRTLVQSSIINTTSQPTYTWDYSNILNATTPLPSGITNVYDYFKSNGTTIPLSPNGNNYWTGGSLGRIQYTGAYQSTADNSVYVPFRQDVELFVPAVPLIEVNSPAPSFYDQTDPATMPNFNSVQYPSTNKTAGYPGTSIFCEFGGVITLTGYPSATGGVSNGTFAVFDYLSYKTTGTTRTGTITTLANSVNVTGVGTKFTTELLVGSLLYDGSGNLIGKVQKIVDDLNLQLKSFSSVVLSGGSYKSVNPLLASAPNSPFVDNGNGTMTFDPTNASLRNGYNDVLITYTYQDNNSPAIGTGYLILRVTPNPQPSFTVVSAVAPAGTAGSSTSDNFCSGSVITFTAPASNSIAQGSTSPANTISTYSWDFGDPNSGTANTASTQVATHTFASSSYNINLSLKSKWGCASLPSTVSPTGSSPVQYLGSTGTIQVGEIPKPKFSVSQNCVGDLISFDASTSSMPSGSSSNSSINLYNWDFNYQVPANAMPSPTPATSSLSSPTGATATYSKEGFYNVALTTITTLGCQATKISSITQLPLKLLPVGASYFDFFDNNNGGGWQPLNINSNLYTSPKAGGTAWTYNGDKWTIPTYNKNEKSALYSACLDLSNIPRPVIQFNAFVNLQEGEGLVLQYSKDSKNVQDSTKVWEVLGTTSTATNGSPGLDWYNSSPLSSLPGTGYTGSTNVSGYGWSKNLNYLQPKHKLEDVTNASGNPNSRVILRFAFAAAFDATTSNGIKIDSVRVGSRTRTILFENFTTTDVGTNTSLPPIISTEMNAIAAFTQANISSTQLVNVNYHVGFVGQNDPFNLDNPADPSARALYYNVTKVPYAFLDGVHSQTASGSDLFKDWGQGAYDLQTLQLARADFLGATPTTVTTNPDGSIQVDVHFVPQVDLPSGINKGSILGVAILEKQITVAPSYGKVNTGETTFNYVLKKMLPDAGGTKFTQPLTANTLINGGTFKWIPQNLHSNKLTVVVFLQNELTKEVYQAELFDDIPAPGPVTAIEPLTEELVKVYPNPSDKEFTVELPQAVTERTSILMTDQLGRSIETGAFNEGEQSKTISTQGLSDGMYILQIGDKSNAVRKKIMVVHN